MIVTIAEACCGWCILPLRTNWVPQPGDKPWNVKKLLQLNFISPKRLSPTLNKKCVGKTHSLIIETSSWRTHGTTEHAFSHATHFLSNFIWRKASSLSPLTLPRILKDCQHLLPGTSWSFPIWELNYGRENFISLLKIKVSHLLYLSVCERGMEIKRWGVSNEDCQTLGTRGERQPFLPFRAPEEKPRPSSRNAHIGLHFRYIAHLIII